MARPWIYVGNLPYGLSTLQISQLSSHIQPTGVILQQMHSRVAFLSYLTDDLATDAVASINEMEFGGRALVAERYNDEDNVVYMSGYLDGTSVYTLYGILAGFDPDMQIAEWGDGATRITFPNRVRALRFVVRTMQPGFDINGFHPIVSYFPVLTRDTIAELDHLDRSIPRMTIIDAWTIAIHNIPPCSEMELATFLRPAGPFIGLEIVENWLFCHSIFFGAWPLWRTGEPLQFLNVFSSFTELQWNTTMNPTSWMYSG